MVPCCMASSEPLNVRNSSGSVRQDVRKSRGNERRAARASRPTASNLTRCASVSRRSKLESGNATLRSGQRVAATAQDVYLRCADGWEGIRTSEVLRYSAGMVSPRVPLRQRRRSRTAEKAGHCVVVLPPTGQPLPPTVAAHPHGCHLDS